MSIERTPGHSELERQTGNLYSITKGKVKHHLDKIDISNGLDWTDDNRTMFYIDSAPAKVYAFDFDIASAEISKLIGMNVITVDTTEVLVTKFV